MCLSCSCRYEYIPICIVLLVEAMGESERGFSIWKNPVCRKATVVVGNDIFSPKAPLVQRPKISNGSCLSARSFVTDFSDFCGEHNYAPASFQLLPGLSRLGFLGIPENDEQTSILYPQE